jgi:outer membrane protein
MRKGRLAREFIVLRYVTLVFAAAIGAANAATAQESPAARDWEVLVGGGALAAPSYEGDDDYRLSILPSIQINYRKKFFASVEGGVGYRVFDTEAFRAGPIARLKFERDDDGDQGFAVTGDDTDDLRGLGDVDTSLELGMFAERNVGPVALGAEIRKAVTGHEGAVVEFGARWSGRSLVLGPPVIWSIGPRARIVDENYNSAYFGVSPQQSTASGLPVFEAEGGLHSYGLGASAIVPLSPEWTAVLFAGLDRLTGDASDNPLVQLRGAENQGSLGFFLSYRAF